MDIVEQLRQYAPATAKATQMMADAKSARNNAAGDVGTCYSGLRTEETVEWKAADEIERLRALLVESDRLADGYYRLMREASDKNERLRALVMLGDFSNLRPNSDSFKLVQQIRRERSTGEQTGDRKP